MVKQIGFAFRFEWNISGTMDEGFGYCSRDHFTWARNANNKLYLLLSRGLAVFLTHGWSTSQIGLPRIRGQHRLNGRWMSSPKDLITLERIQPNHNGIKLEDEQKSFLHSGLEIQPASRRSDQANQVQPSQKDRVYFHFPLVYGIYNKWEINFPVFYYKYTFWSPWIK